MTIEELRERIRNSPPMTADELFEQKVSWCYSMQSRESTLTKDQVRAIVRKTMGLPPESVKK